MGILRRASDETKRIDLGEEDFLVVRMEISKRDFNRFVAFMPGREVNEDNGITAAEATELQKGMFEALVVGWSLEEPATVEAYEALENEGASAIDTALAEHFQSLTPSKAEERAGFRPEPVDSEGS